MKSSYMALPRKILLLFLFCLPLLHAEASWAKPHINEFQCPPAPSAKSPLYSRKAIFTQSCDFLSIFHGQGACEVSTFQSIGKMGGCQYFGATYDSGGGRITASAVFARPISSKSQNYYFLAVNDVYEATHELPHITDSLDGPVLIMTAHNGNALMNDSSYYHWQKGVWHALDNKEDMDQALPKKNSACSGTDLWPDFATMTVKKTYSSKDGACPSKTAIISFRIEDNRFVKKEVTWK